MRLGQLGDIIPYTLPPCLNCATIDPATLPSINYADGTDASGDQPTNPPALITSVAQAITVAASSTMPQATASTLPDVVGTANATMPAPYVLTPQSLNARLPNIVNPSARNAAVSQCDDSFAGWVDQNRLLAIGGLALAAYLLAGRRR